jgi:hypothetical protein
MIVALKDRATLLTIRPARVGTYLQAKGWRRISVETDRYSLWARPSESGEPNEILLPLNATLADFTERMAEMLGDLQRAEGRSQLEILRDIEASSCDVFRFRQNPRSSFLGTMPIESGVRFVAYARDMLLFAASAEHEPGRGTVTGRRSDDVVRFMESALLGQTEISSFVVTAQIPVVARLTESLFPENVPLSEEPFERRAGIRLMTSLKLTRDAALEAAQTNDFRPFEEALRAGATVNLYSTLVEAQEMMPSEALEIECSWAAVRPITGAAPVASVLFEPELILPLRSAVAILKPRAPRENERIFGFVELLHQSIQEVLIGDLSIRTVFDGKKLNVHLSLERPEYDAAILAFRDKRPIEVTGELTKEKNIWVLRNPRNVIVHRGESDAGEEGEEES